ncbi:MAG TPA: LytTR family DNA-binding domain-containing protein [Bacteroidales bacterium]|nr:LytTR family DNA-binding domain-containing protein [Bacteroidales bacterium]
MNIVIIEDEKITADDLAETITKAEPGATIIAILSSVKASVTYFQDNDSFDLIFSDVQLGDGLSFEIFRKVRVKAPIIFCTAYDEYALNAFRTNGIDYILKPFTTKSISEALRKYHTLKQTFSGEQHYKAIIDTLMNRETPKTAAILVHQNDKILPVLLEDIALFYIKTEITWLITFGKKTYAINKYLDELEDLCGSGFFRVNRQCLVNRKAIIDASHYFSRKLSVNISVSFTEKIIVSKEKTPQFLEWLQNAR